MELYENLLFAGRYRLEARLGAGGFGEVWRAQDTITGHPVAIKIHLKGDSARAAQDIVKEYTRVMTIHHDNLLTPSHVDVTEGNVPYLVLELCEGDLADRDLTEQEVWQLILDVSSGLRRLAENKKERQRSDGTTIEVPDPIIHQDIKPANILLRSNGMYAISDFGISKRRLSSLSTNVQDGTESNNMDSAMTVDYAAPERFPRGKGVAVQASDIWSVGAMLYELVEGHRPFAECGGDCLNPAIGLPIPPITREGYSDELKQLVYDCMALHPDDRPTAAQMQAYADKVLRNESRTRTWNTNHHKNPKPAPMWKRTPKRKETPKLAPPSKQKPNILKTILVTLAAAMTALVVGAVPSVPLNAVIFTTPEFVGYASAIVFLVAAIGLFSYFIGYHIFRKERWPHKRIAIIVGVFLVVLIAVLFVISEFSRPYSIYLTYILYSAALSMLTYTLAYKVFKHSGLTQYKWVNWFCFALTFLWCMIWCSGMGIVFCGD